MYTSYYVKAILKPKYVEYVTMFTKEHQWDEDQGPECIKAWHEFQKKHEQYHEVEDQYLYLNRIPMGLPSPWWGSECIVYEGNDEDSSDMVHWWTFSGELKNKHMEIEYFMQHIVTELTSKISLCWTCHETQSLFVEHKDDVIRKGNMTLS